MTADSVSIVQTADFFAPVSPTDKSRSFVSSSIVRR
jgi:hypothetical protein